MEKEMTKDEIEAAEKAKELGLPATWEDVQKLTEYPPIDSCVVLETYVVVNGWTNLIEAHLSKEEAEAHFAFLKLHVLRDIYRKDWKPNWNGGGAKYVIKVSADSPIIYGDFCVRSFLSFPDELTAYLFYMNFKDMILQAKDLI